MPEFNLSFSIEDREAWIRYASSTLVGKLTTGEISDKRGAMAVFRSIKVLVPDKVDDWDLAEKIWALVAEIELRYYRYRIRCR